MSFIFPSIYQRVFRIVLLHKVYKKKNKYNVQNYVSRVYLLIHTLTEMDNYFPGAFFTLVPFNPNSVNPSLIRVKTRPQT